MSIVRLFLFIPAVCSLISISGADDIPQKLLTQFREEFVRIAPGEKGFPKTFTMGSDDESNASKPAHEVTMPDGEWWMHRYEMTQELYEAAMGENPSRWKGKRNSAERMTILEAAACCDRLTTALRAAELIEEDQVVRLPTEIEWEYCCRAGTSTRFSFGDEARKDGDTGAEASLLDPFAWHTGNAAGNDPEVGVLKPNAWGLYDMHGYLVEFVLGEWEADHSAAADEANSRSRQAERTKLPRKFATIRGGSWKDEHTLNTSATRRSFPTDGRDDASGFRCVLATVLQEKQPRIR